ncbi:MAG TPA: hemolysin family protein, partial [Nitrolancea sp.]|nr:hemolysin family protein [Nitrolancea sp.]
IRSSLVLIELIAAGVAASFLVILFDREFGRQSTLVAVVINLGLLLTLARAVPNLIIASQATHQTERFERIGAVLASLMVPIVGLTDGLSKLVARGHRDNDRGQFDEYVEVTSDARDSSGQSDADSVEEEHEMISNILDLDQAMVHEIMVPRTDIAAVSLETPVIDVVDLARRAGHSRIPVYRDSIDSIIGVVHAKDFLRFVDDDIANVKLMELLRPAYFVPESKRVGELLQDLRREKVHLAVVVDEYGGTAGIVTIEDILEEIVGEIQDEYDRELPLVERVGPDEVIVDGRIPIDEVAEIFGTDFSEGDYDTIGGFVQQQLGRIPDAGEVVESVGLRFEVQTVEHRRIRTVRVMRQAALSTISGENG